MRLAKLGCGCQKSVGQTRGDVRGLGLPKAYGCATCALGDAEDAESAAANAPVGGGLTLKSLFLVSVGAGLTVGILMRVID